MDGAQFYSNSTPAELSNLMELWRSASENGEPEGQVKCLGESGGYRPRSASLKLCIQALEKKDGDCKGGEVLHKFIRSTGNTHGEIMGSCR